MYVSETQKQADRQLATIADVLERNDVRREVNAYGHSRGWASTILRADCDFSAMSVGLDTAARGLRLDEFRPDLLIFDDVDGLHDSERATRRKIETITQSLLPAGAPHMAVLFIQNLIHDNSIASQLYDGRADFLMDREVHLEVAADDLAYELLEDGDERRYVVTGGCPSWDGQSLEAIEHQINTWGLTAFEREAQHNLSQADGIWDGTLDIERLRVRPDQVPPLGRIAVAVDPASGGSAETGIMAGGIDLRPTPHGYLLEDATVISDPAVWAQAVVDACRRHGTKLVIAEGNNGGGMVRTLIQQLDPSITVELVYASKGKRARGELVQPLHRRGLIHHVGTFTRLERQMTRWRTGDPSPDRMDAMVWLWTNLLVEQPAPVASGSYSTTAWGY